MRLSLTLIMHLCWATIILPHGMAHSPSDPNIQKGKSSPGVDELTPCTCRCHNLAAICPLWLSKTKRRWTELLSPEQSATALTPLKTPNHFPYWWLSALTGSQARSFGIPLLLWPKEIHFTPTLANHGRQKYGYILQIRYPASLI